MHTRGIGIDNDAAHRYTCAAGVLRIFRTLFACGRGANWPGVSIQGLRHVILTAVILMPAASVAGPGPNSFIRLIDSDKEQYAPGMPATVTVTLLNNTGTIWSGRVVGVLCSRTHQLSVPVSVPTGALGVNASRAFSLPVTGLPQIDYTGYAFYVGAFSGGGTVGCTSVTGSATDTAMIGIDISSDTIKFPRQGFLAHYDSSVDVASETALWRQYRLNSIIAYDMYHEAHAPFAPGTYTNFEGNLVDPDTVNAVLAHLHGNNMTAGFFDDAYLADSRFMTDGLGVEKSWGLFFSPCNSACGITKLADAGMDVGAPFTATNFYYMNLNDQRWRSFYWNQLAKVFQNFAFDYWQIDTLGYAGPTYDASGNPVDIGSSLAGYSCAAAESLNIPVQINNVSAWSQNDIDMNSCGQNVFSERHPEFGDMQSFFDIAWAAAEDRQYTSRLPVYPVYVNLCAAALQGGCTQAGSHVFFNDWAVRLTDEGFLIAGANHLEMGDYSPSCHGIAMVNGPFWTSPGLCASPALQAAEYDLQNFATAYENILYDGTFLSNFPVSLVGAPASTTAEAGSVFVQAKQKPGFQIVHLLNLTNQVNNCLRQGRPALCYQDMSGSSIAAPGTLTNLGVKMYYFGAISASYNPLYVISPETDHGRPLLLSYSAASDSGGTYITFVLPKLQGYAAIILETNALVSPGGGDYTLNASQLIPLAGYNDAAPGYGTVLISATKSTQGVCCGRWGRYRKVDLGNGYHYVSINAQASEAATAEIHVDAPNGPLLASLTIPASANFQTYEAPVAHIAGIHGLYVAAPPGSSGWSGAFLSFN